ncbi:MAG: hypothetical protein KF777_09625 [Planctomycetaceae bacterium]|nr:hypothetical protein [Planctomycetaceae bacterium]
MMTGHILGTFRIAALLAISLEPATTSAAEFGLTPVSLAVEWSWEGMREIPESRRRELEADFRQLARRTGGPAISWHEGPIEDASDELVLFHISVSPADVGVSFQLTLNDRLTPANRPVLIEHVGDLADLPRKAMRKMLRLMPLRARLSELFDERAVLELQAGELAWGDPELDPLPKGGYLQPFLVLRDRDGVLKSTRPIPWTWLRVESRDGGQLTCEILSGIRQSLNARQRGRVEVLAVRVDPTWWPGGTVVHAWRLSDPPRPWGLLAVDLRQDEPASDSENPASPPRSFLADRDGRISISAASGGIVWLTAQSGAQKLARVPVLAGSIDELRLELPDDSPRLAVEVAVKSLEQDLVVTVATRASLVAAARLAAKAERWTDVDRLLDRLSKLPTAKVYRDRLNGLRVNGLQVADDRKDRLGRARIEALCRQMGETIDRYLNDDPLRQLREELSELRAASSNETPAKAPPKP